MKIKIIQVGKTKAKYLEAGIEEFLKRLRPYLQIDVVTVKEFGVGKTVSREKCLEEEGVKILKAIDSAGYLVVLDEKGKEFGSVEFANLLKRSWDVGRTVTFVIGGTFGVADVVKKRADLILALSKMTFTHEMVRLFLLEQIYRGVAILRGKEYHVA